MRKTLLRLGFGLLTCGLAMSCSAQTMMAKLASDAEIEKAVAIEAPAPQPATMATHKFFDRQGIASTVMTFSAALADGITTQHALGIHRTQSMTMNGMTTTTSTVYLERNPIAAPLVNRGWPGQIAATALTTGADLSIRSWLHHTGHHRMERVMPFVFAATSASFAAHNARYW